MIAFQPPHLHSQLVALARKQVLVQPRRVDFQSTRPQSQSRAAVPDLELARVMAWVAELGWALAPALERAAEPGLALAPALEQAAGPGLA